MIEECGDDIEAVDEWGTLTDIFDCTASASVKVEAAVGVASRDVFISAISSQECIFKESQLPMNVWDNDDRSVVFLNVSHATPIAPMPVDDKNRNILRSFWIARLAWSPWTMRRPVMNETCALAAAPEEEFDLDASLVFFDFNTGLVVPWDTSIIKKSASLQGTNVPPTS